MTVTYKNAPLVELVVELRWGPGAVVGPFAQQQISVGPSVKSEEFYMHFSGLMFENGFGRFERLVPPAMISVASQATCRFRPTDPSSASPLFQVGQNVFTANALPPYKSWLDFEPKLRIGVTSLLEAMRRTGLPPPQFTVQIVRYINAFKENLTGGRSVRKFAKEVLGLSLELPPVLLSTADNIDAIQTNVQIAVPTKLGRLEITCGEGQNGNERAIMLDSSLLMQEALADDPNQIMNALTKGRGLLHETFREMTAPIRNLMETNP